MSDILEAVKEAVQAPYHQDLQEAMWSAVGPWFWRGMSVVASLGTLILFKNLLHDMRRRHELGLARWDAIVIGRLMWLGAFILAAFTPVNSAYQPWSLAVFVTAGLYMAFLLDSGFCRREGTFWQKIRAIAKDYREAFRDRPAVKDVTHIGHD